MTKWNRVNSNEEQLAVGAAAPHGGCSIGTTFLVDETGDAIGRRFTSLAHLCQPGVDVLWFGFFTLQPNVCRRADSLRAVHRAP